MRSNLKISLCVLVAFSISFSVLLLFLITNPLVSDDGVFIFFHPSDREHAKFYSQDFISDEKKIFIYGSSMVWPLNPGLIEENLKKNELDYKIYNLGIGGSKPENTEKFLDMIISAQPDIVAYGISDRDFITDEWVLGEENENFFRLEKPPQVLPEPSRIFGELFASAKVVLNFDTDFLRAPQTARRSTKPEWALFPITFKALVCQLAAIAMDNKSFPVCCFFSFPTCKTVFCIAELITNLSKSISL